MSIQVKKRNYFPSSFCIFIIDVVLWEKSIFVGSAEVVNFNHMSSLCLFCVHTKGKQCMDGHKTSNDNIGLNQNFLPFVVMVWTLQRVQWNLSYEHQHVSNEIEIQPGSSNVETDLCLTSVFSPWYAPLISLDGDYAKSQFSAACIFCHRLNRTFFCQLYLRLISYQSLLVFCWSKSKTHRGLHFITGISEKIIYFACKSCLARTPLVGRCP